LIWRPARNERACALVLSRMKDSRTLARSSFLLTALLVIGAVTLAALSVP